MTCMVAQSMMGTCPANKTCYKIEAQKSVASGNVSTKDQHVH